ncbi:MAG: universal stress protein [Acidimicrobiia bacterium]
MQRILVGTDGSGAATEAVAWAANLARSLDDDLIVATVLTPGLAGLDAGDTAEQRSRVVHLLDTEWCDAARAVRPDLHTLVLEGDPRTRLLDAAASEHSDLLVVGSSGTGWFPALHLGHVAHAIAHHTNVPLVVLPRDGHAPTSGPLLVGVDGSAGSAAAIRWTADLARSLDREVLAVHVHPERGRPERHAELEQRCAEWTAPLRSARVTTRVLILEGWPAKVIADLEVAEHPALVVVGARGAGGFRDLRLGSTSLQLLHHARTPIAIVPLSE